jgi:type I restriction-modification system DNA methylase subunit
MSKRPMSVKPKEDFIRGLNKLDRSRSVSETFRDMMEMAYCAHAKLMAPTDERANELEARYMGIVNRYQNKDTIRAFPELLNIAWETVAAGGVDFLGEVSSELAVLDARNGQFFTPYAVSRMLAEMGLNGLERVIEEKGYFTLSEPACGAGGMVLAAADMVERMGYNYALTMLVEAVDVSPLAYYMTYLQLTWRGVTAHVVRGNTLSMERFESAWTITARWFKDVHGHLFDRPEAAQPTPQPAVVDVEQVEPEPEFYGEPIQMALF